MARPKGSRNKVTGAAKAVIAAFIDDKAPEVAKLWDQVASEDPARAVDLYAKLAEYVVPKLGRTEVMGKDGEPVRVSIAINGIRREGMESPSDAGKVPRV